MNKKLDIIDAETLADMRLEPVQLVMSQNSLIKKADVV